MQYIYMEISAKKNNKPSILRSVKGYHIKYIKILSWDIWRGLVIYYKAEWPVTDIWPSNEEACYDTYIPQSALLQLLALAPVWFSDNIHPRKVSDGSSS